MASPNPEARLNVALKQTEYAKGILTELLEELWQAADDQNAGPETAFFLINELQEGLSRTRTHVNAYFGTRENVGGKSARSLPLVTGILQTIKSSIRKNELIVLNTPTFMKALEDAMAEAEGAEE